MENQLQTDKLIQQVKNATGYIFKNSNYLLKALTVRNNNSTNPFNNNEVLEFIGDKIIGMSIVQLLIKYFDLENFNDSNDKLQDFRFKYIEYFKSESYEGILTQIENNFVQGEYLAKCFLELNLEWEWLLDKNAQNQHIEQNKDSNERNFEALIGAIYLDSNFDINTIIQIVDKLLHFDETMNDYHEFKENYISELDEWIKLHPQNSINYIESQCKNNNNENSYECLLTVHINGFNKFEFIGIGISNDEAKYNVAKIAYDFLKNNGYIKPFYEEEIGCLTVENALSKLNELIQKSLIKITWNEDIQLSNNYWQSSLVNKVLGKFTGVGSNKQNAKTSAAYSFLNKLIDYNKQNY